ncbi:NAD(P)H:menadione oxidoreductase [Giardia duodenalis]|uniref:NAD(P)H:menadione oxidoreductase n=1 Tax=Giardia intestinalis TaxID=5741 RepID=V6TFR6_GIAIN|nr:NAD(P)H:menadione oxidoreductase [Giardia intestinalis]
MHIVLYYSHPAELKSVVNAPLVEAAKKLKNVEVRWLDELYPSLHMTPEQVSEEQRIIEKADAVFFQFPVHWFSSPPSLSVFMDSVLTYGWAYGSKAVIAGKRFRVIYTCGARWRSTPGSSLQATWSSRSTRALGSASATRSRPSSSSPTPTRTR